MPVQIEELRAYFTANYSDFVNGTQRVIGTARTLGSEVAKISRAASNSINRIGIATTALAVKATAKFASFELAMARAGAVTNTLGSRDFVRLENAAKKMGETTVFSASQAAEAINQMGLAGLKTNEIITALPGALELASAAQVSIAQASDIAAKTMRAFGADARELGHINDVLVATFTKSNTDLPQLAEAMKHVAPVSKGLGVSMEDTAAAIAKMSDAGFQGSMAGTALRNIFSRLAGAVPEATTKLNELGVVTTDAQGKMLPFLNILQQIERAGMTDAQVLQIFGQRGGPQLMALLEVGSAGLREFSHNLEESGGVAKRISDANLDTLDGQFKLLLSAIESVQLELGRELRPQMEELFGFIVANKDTLSGLASGFAKFVIQILKFVTEHPRLAAMLALLKAGSLLGINQLVTTLAGSLFKLTGYLAGFVIKGNAAAATMVGLKAAAVGLAVAGIAVLAYKIYNANEDLRAFNEALKDSKRLSTELSDSVDKRLIKTIERAQRIGGDGGRRILSEELERAEKNITGLSASLKGQQRIVDDLSSTWNTYTGNKVLAGEVENLEDLEQKLAAAKSRAEQLRDAMQGISSGGGVQSSPAAMFSASDVASGESGVSDGSDVESMLRNARLAGVEGAAGIADFLSAGANGSQLSEMLQLGGMDAETAGKFGLQSVAVDPESQAEVDAFAVKIAETMQKAIEAEQARQDIVEANKQALDHVRSFAGDIVANIEQLDEADGFKEKFAGLYNAFKSGKISAEQFSQSMMDLKSATDQAVAAAEKKAQQELREKVLKGDFSGLDPKKALEDKLYQYRMQQFNQQIDKTFKSMVGLSDSVKPVSEKFNDLKGSMDSFNGALQGNVDGSKASQALGQFFSVVASSAGQQALLFNEIQSLKQALQYALDPRRRSAIQDRIANLSSALNSLPSQSYTVGMSDPYADPGLSRASTVQVNLPNITRVTNEDVRQLTDAISTEIQRRGSRF